jgi:hypothetical protein
MCTHALEVVAMDSWGKDSTYVWSIWDLVIRWLKVLG